MLSEEAFRSLGNVDAHGPHKEREANIDREWLNNFAWPAILTGESLQQYMKQVVVVEFHLSVHLTVV